MFAQRFHLTRPLSKGSERRKNIKKNGGFYTKSEWTNLKRRYDFRCLRCTRQEPYIKLQADHIVPIIRGGVSWVSNIQPLCGPCNGEKGTAIIDYRAVKFEPGTLE
ncbi:MAG: HNH endonuclease [Pseudonocardiaceae bacterium]